MFFAFYPHKRNCLNFLNPYFFSTFFCCSAMPILGKKNVIHTNCIVTLVWADGVMRTKPIMFTSASTCYTLLDVFTRVASRARNWKLTSVRRTKLLKFQSSMELFGIEPFQVQALSHKSPDYTRETGSLIRKALILWKTYGFDLDEENQKIPLDFSKCFIFSDGGGAFTSGGRSVLQTFGVGGTDSYPSSVHQYLSPNDNKLHGEAKAKWRASKYYEDTEVDGPLYLLNALSTVPKDHISGWFHRNFLLDPREQNYSFVANIVKKGGNLEEEDVYIENNALYAYQSVVLKTVDKWLEGCIRKQKTLESGLDGVYW